MGVEDFEFVSEGIVYEVANGRVLRNGNETGIIYMGIAGPGKIYYFFPRYPYRTAMNRYQEILSNKIENEAQLDPELIEPETRLIGKIEKSDPFITTDQLKKPYEFWASPVIDAVC